MAVMSDRTSVYTNDAPNAVGPYSQAIVAGGIVYCSGQVGLDPATQTMVEGGVEAQAKRALTNLAAVLEASGSSLSRVVRTTIFLTSMGDFAAVNGIYGEFFAGDAQPARATVEVAALPAGAMVEIDCISLVE